MADGYVRICDNCGHRWVVTDAVAKMKAPREGKVKRIERANRLAIGRSGFATQSASLRDQLTTVQQATTCGQCGSGRYSQYRPDQAPPATPQPSGGAQVPPPPPPQSQQAEWRSDPTGRHELRYFDGASWTEHVADQGKQSVDPMP